VCVMAAKVVVAGAFAAVAAGGAYSHFSSVRALADAEAEQEKRLEQRMQALVRMANMQSKRSKSSHGEPAARAPPFVASRTWLRVGSLTGRVSAEAAALRTRCDRHVCVGEVEAVARRAHGGVLAGKRSLSIRRFGRGGECVVSVACSGGVGWAQVTSRVYSYGAAWVVDGARAPARASLNENPNPAQPRTTRRVHARLARALRRGVGRGWGGWHRRQGGRRGMGSQS
jgi:hypothetical protein